MLDLKNSFNKKSISQFLHDGIFVIKKGLTSSEINFYKETSKTLASYLRKDETESKKTFRLRGIARNYSAFRNLINHSKWIGYLYDFYGEQLKLTSSELIIRPPATPESQRNGWHFDGPRLLPFRTFSKIPLRIKTGIWLTENNSSFSSRFIYVPGSHLNLRFNGYGTHKKNKKELALNLEEGDIFLFAEGLWHRVEENNSNDSRYSLYFEYAPSWIQTTDPNLNPKITPTLSREQRILLRNYDDDFNQHIKIPSNDYPLNINAKKFIIQKHGAGQKHLSIHTSHARRLIEKAGLI